MTALAAIALVLCGLVIGIFSGLLGVGGGVLIVPLLRVAFGFEAIAATATSLFTIIFTSASGMATHLRNRTSVPLLGVAMGLGGAVTGTFGVMLSRISPGWLVMLVAAAVILYSAYTMIAKALQASRAPSRRAPGASTAPMGRAGGKAIEDRGGDEDEAFSFVMTPKRFAAGFCIGMAAGLLSGYVGVGGGFIMVPLMIGLLGIPMRLASGTSLTAVMILAVPSTVANILYGNVAFVAGACLVLGSIPGAVIGARLINRFSERQLRLAFAAFLILAAVLLLIREFAL